MPDKMISMKRTESEKKEYSGEVTLSENSEEYPWGLRINLNKDELEKLSITKLPQVGTMLKIAAMVKVVQIRESADTEGEDRNIELQITDMNINPEDTRDAAEVLYGGSNGGK